MEGTGLMHDEKSLEELDQVLGIVHGVPFTEKKSAVLLMHRFFESFASLFCERNRLVAEVLICLTYIKPCLYYFSG